MLTLKMLFIGCAAAGGLTLLLQVLLSVVGIGDGHEGVVDSHTIDAGGHDDGSGFGLLSVRAVAAFLTFFGLTGWWAATMQYSAAASAAVATAAGAAAMLLVAWIISQQKRLDSQGNLDPNNAIGQPASVYLRIPAKGGGHGKIQVKVQGRTAEFAAVSDGGEIPTGAAVRVVRMITADTFAVAPLDETTGDR